MQYKTIILELLQDQYPALHEQLRRSRNLLSTLDEQASALKRYHESWIDRLTLKKPDSDPVLIASQALELGLLDLRDNLPSGSAPTDADETFCLDEAMGFVRNHTPPA